MAGCQIRLFAHRAGHPVYMHVHYYQNSIKNNKKVYTYSYTLIKQSQVNNKYIWFSLLQRLHK